MAHIIKKIELLQERLNKMIINKDDNMEIYQVSTELDTWIVKYYNEDKQYIN